MPPSARQTLLLSVDFEDWHQLVRRRVGMAGWEQPGPALARQTEAALGLLDELGVRATFFILGMSARAHPELVEAIAARGHEIGCHGHGHVPVHMLTPAEFAVDLRAARRTIEALTGRAPVGYRAPAFSITRDSEWAYRVLADEGFGYDASQHDTPVVRAGMVSASATPHQLTLDGGLRLWEFPVAVWRLRGVTVPVGGASYWSTMPTQTVLRGLANAGQMAGLYLHPHELDPEPLRPALAPGVGRAQRLQAGLRAAQRNVARLRASRVLRAIAGGYALIPYGEAHAELSAGAAARP